MLIMVFPIFGYYSYHWSFQLSIWTLALLYLIMFLSAIYRIKSSMIHLKKYQIFSNLILVSLTCLSNFHTARILLMISGHLGINEIYRVFIGNLTSCLYATLLIVNICIIIDCCSYLYNFDKNHYHNFPLKYSKAFLIIVLLLYFITPGLFFATQDSRMIKFYFPFIMFVIWTIIIISSLIISFLFIKLARNVYSQDIIKKMAKSIKLFASITLLAFVAFWAGSIGYVQTNNIYGKSAIYFMYFLVGDFAVLAAFVKYLYKMKVNLSRDLDDIAIIILRSSSKYGKSTSLTI